MDKFVNRTIQVKVKLLNGQDWYDFHVVHYKKRGCITMHPLREYVSFVCLIQAEMRENGHDIDTTEGNISLVRQGTSQDN